MRLSRLAFEVRAGMAHRPVQMLAAACAALALAACGGANTPTAPAPAWRTTRCSPTG